MSPIHDQSYRRYAGERRALGRAWGVIAWTGIRSMLSRKWFLGPAARLVDPVHRPHRAASTCVTMYPAAEPDAAGRRAACSCSSSSSRRSPVFFVTVFVGSGLIAADRRANALQIYLSKPLLRMEYIGGKLAILVAFLMFVTLRARAAAARRCR